MKRTFLYIHRVINNANSKMLFGPDAANALTESQFTELLESLNEKLRNWEHLVIDTESQFDDNVFTLTFDDGFQDFIEVVLPHIEKINVKVLLFVSTLFASGRSKPYEYIIASLIERLSNMKLPHEYFGNSETTTNKELLYHQIRNFIQYQKPKIREKFLIKLFEENKMTITDISLPKMLSWKDLRKIDKHPLVDIGSHSISHSLLPSIGWISAWREIWESKRIIEKQLNHSISTFSYPYGANTKANRLMVFAAGYKYGFTTSGQKYNRMAIPRLDATEWLRRLPK